MPCYTGQENDRSDYEARKQIERLEALLCAVIRGTGLGAAMERADWTDAGTNAADLKQWWVEHEAKDHARRTRERIAAEANQARQTAIRRMTLEEAQALGVGREWHALRAVK